MYQFVAHLNFILLLFPANVNIEVKKGWKMLINTKWKFNATKILEQYIWLKDIIVRFVVAHGN